MKRWCYVEFWWAVHNLIAHPLSQLIWWTSLCGLIGKTTSGEDVMRFVRIDGEEAS